MQEQGPRLLALARGVVRDSHVAEDIVQESFVKLWRQPPEAAAAIAGRGLQLLLPQMDYFTAQIFQQKKNHYNYFYN